MAEDTETIEKPYMVPKARLDDEVEKRKHAEKAQAEMQDRIEALEARDKTDVERLTKEVEKLQAKATAFEEKYNGEVSARQADQRSAWVQAAAAKANFHDPSVAARMADLDGIEDAASAEKAVKMLAKDNSWLVKSSDVASGKLERVGKEGDVVEQARESGQGVPAEKLLDAWGAELLTGLTGQQGVVPRTPSGQEVVDSNGEKWVTQ